MSPIASSALLALSLLTPAAHAIVISVDGNLADWGIQPTGQASDWTPLPGIHYSIEDQTGGINTYLNPGWGGQAYDAEALYALIQGNTLYIALATGHNPRTLHKPSTNSYGAGDFGIDFGRNGVYELGINVKHVIGGSAGSPIFETFGVSGGVYANPIWNMGLWQEVDPTYPITTTKRPAYLTGGDYLGLAHLVYTTPGANGYGQWPRDLHYFYEIALDLNLLRTAGWNGMDPFNIHWTMNCGNDSIHVRVDPPPVDVPEPATLALLSLGLLGLTVLRRRPAR